MSELETLRKEIEKLKERNQRVEADKAWEGSAFRVLSLCVITYFIAAAVMYAIGVVNIWTNALVPTVGYFLSTQSLPFIKKWWVANYLKK